MIVNLKGVLDESYAKKRCVLAANIYNLETIEAALKASLRMEMPIILAFGERYFDHANPRQIVSIIENSSYIDRQRVVIHLDHASSFDAIQKALDSGFTSIMYDGSCLSLNENIQATIKAREIARKYGASIEAELGYLNEEDGYGHLLESAEMTRVVDAVQFVMETEVDALAIAIGNAHGVYKGDPNLDFQRLSEISEAVDIPLVLHGTSGIPKEQILKAIGLGIAKINVNTEIAMSGAESIRSALHDERQARLESLMRIATETMERTITGYLELLKN